MPGTGQFNEVYPILGAASFQTSYTANTPVKVLDAGGGPGRVDVLLGRNADTVDHSVDVFVVNAAAIQVIVEAKIPAGAGVGGVPAFDMLAQAMPSGQQGLWFPAGGQINAALPAAPGAGFVIVEALGGTL